jgi:hypothetical protein
MYTFMKIFCKINLLMQFSHSKLSDLKAIHDLYPQCLTRTLSKTILFTKLDGVKSIDCGSSAQPRT